MVMANNKGIQQVAIYSTIITIFLKQAYLHVIATLLIGILVMMLGDMFHNWHRKNSNTFF
jgi:hypothetical protein